MLYMIKKGRNLVFFEFELGSDENFFVFGHDAGIEGKSNLARGNHADYFPTRSVR